jgi:acyl-CoA synthetase (NDP forming)
MPHTGTLGNPVDLTFSKSPMDYFADIPAVLLQEENTDILMVYFLAPSAFIERALNQMGLAPEKVAEESRKLALDAAAKFVRVVKAQNKPVVGFTYRSLGEEFTRHLITRGIPIFPDPKRASRALRGLLDYKDWKAGSGLQIEAGREAV